ncbi:MAG: uroporphyrinogen-III synthase [Acidobacteriota bacterium]|nr:uroporphyrinogen-III synthase [Acidobacteriota bacterium]
MPPLDHVRILITRSRQQAPTLAVQLESLGAVPIVLPAIEIVPPESYAPLDAALARLDAARTDAFDWLLFTSANAVEVFAQRRNPDFVPQRIGAIGPATARAVQALGLHVDLVPPRYIAESFAEALLPFAPGRSFLLLRAAEARDHLPEALTAAGASVTIAEAYANRLPGESVVRLRELLAGPASAPHAVTFTSASTARNLALLLEAAGVSLPADAVLASIGPITSQAMREQGLEPTVEAREATLPALVDALVSVLAK